MPLFSDPPTDLEIFRARIFEEPLVPAGPTSAQENRQLATVLRAYLDAPVREDVTAVERFLGDRPDSAWRLSLLTNLGIVTRRTGYFTKALALDREAWYLGKNSTEVRVRATADRALAELAELYARLGKTEELEALLAEIEGRDVGGSASERIVESRQGLALMKTRPEIAFRCGPMAVETILALMRPGSALDPRISDALSTRQGTSLLQMRDLSQRLGLKMRMARRQSLQAPILAPALVHWKAGHFAAIEKEAEGRYLVKDPTFGEEFWASRKALDEETSGSFLVVDDGRELPSGWAPISDQEGTTVWGKGAASGQSPNFQKKPNAPSTNCPWPMAGYSFFTMLAALRLEDTPVGYTPPVGPAVQFVASYSQREAFQPQIFTYSNLGPKWTFEWLSYVSDDPSDPSQTANVYLRGGGLETYTGFNPLTRKYAADFDSRAVLVRTSASPIRYERRLPDGTSDVFSQPDGSLSFPRKVLLTASTDAQGNIVQFLYDDFARLVAVVDGLGQVTTLSYDLPLDNLKITRVTDPFGRAATFDYDATGRLARITDVIGLTSEFTYETGDFISALTTPYGTTRFETGQSGADRWIQATDPLGGVEKLMYVNGHSPVVPSSDPSATVPIGFAGSNLGLDQAMSFFWDKRAMALAPGDFSKAEVTHWLWTNGTTQASAIPRATKKPLENRVWYAYAGQTETRRLGTDSRPITVGRVLDDGTSQIYRYEYNTKGKTIKETDPVARETDYFYGTSNVIDPDQTTGTGIDLLQVKQKNGAGFDLIASYTYNSQRLPLTVADAAGQTTTYTYDPQGRVATATTPPRAGITENRTTTYAYYPDTAPTGAGRVQTVTAPATGATTTYEYDGFGRVSKVTDSEGYAVITAYDALDRPTTVTYPDGTSEQTVYNRLDAEQRRDRLGRWSRTFYDPLRRVVATRDPLGRTVTQQWCNCGSLDKLIDPNGNATAWERDLQARVTKEIRADPSNLKFPGEPPSSQFTYETTTSRLKSVTDARSQTKTYGYGLDDRLTTITYTNAAVATPNATFSYMDPDNPTAPDPYGRLRLMTDGTGTTRYDYKPAGTLGAGSLSSVDGPLANDTVSYTYDELGRVTTHGLSTFSTTSEYDALARLNTLTSPMGSFRWTYVNTTGRPQTVTYPNAQTTTYSYFGNVGDQRLQQIKHQQTAGGTALSQFDYTYDAVGNIKTWTQQRGTDPAKVYTLGYDAADQLLTATVTGPNPLPVPGRFRYAYDNAGNRSAEELDDAGTGATYNNRNQLTSRQPGGTLLFRGTLSEQATVTVQGKPTQVAPDNSFAAPAQVSSGATNVEVAATDPSGNTRTNTYQVTESGSTTTYTYDQNGNLTADGTRTFNWDAENHLTRVTQGASELARFTYDGQGRRAQKIAGGVTHTYIYDGGNIIEERLSSGQTYDFVQGPGVDRPLAMRDQASVVSYYLADHLGSIAQTTSAAGAVTLTREYDPWGNPIQGSATAGYAFTGREWDPEIQAYYYRARFYEPTLARFLSADPLGHAGGINPYTYVENAPTRFIDPTGLQLVVPGPPPPPDPPVGCSAGPWKFVRQGSESTEKDIWRRKQGPQPRLPAPQPPAFRGGGGSSATFCLCYYELAGRERITRVYSLFERTVCCSGQQYTEQRRMYGPENRKPIPIIMSNPPPMVVTRGGINLGGSCFCPPEP
jgi:RHS repeat-associated protein